MVLKKFLRAFPGSAFSTLIETETSETCVLKMGGAGNGVQSLVAEFVVNRAASLAGWSVPDVFPVVIPENFPWQFGTDEFDDLVRKSFGTNLGIRFLKNAHPVKDISTLQLETLRRLCTIDALFGNYDRLVVSQNILRDEAGTEWIIDHGSCLFLQSSIPKGLPSNHMLKGREDDLLGHATLKWDVIEKAVFSIPKEWLLALEIATEDVLTAIRNRM